MVLILSPQNHPTVQRGWAAATGRLGNQSLCWAVARLPPGAGRVEAPGTSQAGGQAHFSGTEEMIQWGYL